MQSTLPLEPLCVDDVSSLLHQQCAVITGGKSKEGCPLITFPDQNNFHTLSDTEYQRLMLYLISVPSLQEADLGFHLIIDRRKDRWNSVKTVLLKISVYFPALIHVVYVLRPESFLQKAISEVSNKLFKDDFKFRMIILGNEEELLEYIDENQLTSDLGGTLPYSNSDWIQQRMDLEKFSTRTHQVSDALDEFTKCISETEFPNNVDSTQQLLNQQSVEYSRLKDEIIKAAKHGEDLLSDIREKSEKHSDSQCKHSNHTLGNVFAVERLLVQLEETERTFDDFWATHSMKLRHCLELRRFEQDFRELQVNFDSHMKTVSEMTEVGQTVTRVEQLIRETVAFQKLCYVDIERGEEVIASGRQLLNIKNSCPLECVEPKCNELVRVREILMERLNERVQSLCKNKDLLEKIENVIQWCSRGVDLLSSQNIDKCSQSVETANESLLEIQKFAASVDKAFKTIAIAGSLAPETKASIDQSLEKVQDVTAMCEKRIATLRSFAERSPSKQNVNDTQTALPRQPSIGAPMPHNVRKLNATTAKMELSAGTNSTSSSEFTDTSYNDFDPCQDEMQRVKQRHVLAELLDTERVYVTELASIIEGYKKEALSKGMQHLLPSGLTDDKLEILFGNIEEIHEFHSNIFLKDLENCISSIDLVALCFIQKKDLFYQLYSFYCQNIPRSEQLRETLVDNNQFFQMCQQKLGHKLPLAAYLLKPVQRITKYQLLLGDLLKYCDDNNSCKQLQGAVDCMLIVLKCVNDSMLQICITGFPLDLSQQGDLLLQGSFSVWIEYKKDIRLRIKPLQRHIFLYQKAMLFCKASSKNAYNKTSFQFKHYLKMSQIGLTESVKGDMKKFEVWLQGRQEVYTIQSTTIEQKHAWVNEIKRVLLNQLEELKGEKIKQYTAAAHKHMRQTTSWENRPIAPTLSEAATRTMSCDVDPRSNEHDDCAVDAMESTGWSSDGTNSDEEESNQPIPSGRYIALADYCAVGNSEVNMREGDIVELLKVGCAGWWYIKTIGTNIEGWAPAAYLESVHRKPARCSSRSHDRFTDH